MQTTRKAVRYYIDREADTPVVRSVPVPSIRPAHVEAVRLPTMVSVDGQDESATTTYHASESRRRHTRGRLAELVQTTVRRRRRHTS